MARSKKPAEREEPPDHEVDLHGLRGEQALRRLAQELHAWRLRGVARALVITGRGIQSEQGAVLAPLVESWLATDEARRLGVLEWKPTRRGGAFELRLAWATRAGTDGEDEA